MPVPSPVTRIVAALAVTQTVGYGCLYYSFAVFLEPVSTDLGASRTAVTGAFTLSVLTAAALAVPVGRRLDRHGARGLMTTGSVVGSLLLVAFAHVHGLVGLYLAWSAIGAVGAMVLYEAAFATVIAWSDPARRAGALLAVTVVAGFSSSIFLPLTGFLVDRYGWRDAALTLAGLHAAVTVPLHALVVRRPPHLRRRDRSAEDDARRRAVVRAALRDPRYWLFALGFTAQSAAISTMTLHLIGFLVEAGHPPTTAATITGSLGVLSVAGRVAVTGVSRRFAVHRVVGVVFAVQSLAALALPALAATTAGALVGVVGFGVGFGVSHIARPALLTQAYGTAAFATLSGMLAAPATVALATAPLAGAALQHATRSSTPVLTAIAACCAVSATSIALSGAASRRRPAPQR